MIPSEFRNAYLDTAKAVRNGTGIDSYVLLAQWARETGWGTAFAGANNLGNIRCSPNSFCSYGTLAEFASACVATFHNGDYPGVLAARTPGEMLAAIIASPWDSTHYGGSLESTYKPLEALRKVIFVLRHTSDGSEWTINDSFTRKYPVDAPKANNLNAVAMALGQAGTYVVNADALLDTLITGDPVDETGGSGGGLTAPQATSLSHIESMLETGLAVTGTAKGA